jgi:hypothetical protein
MRYLSLLTAAFVVTAAPHFFAAVETSKTPPTPAKFVTLFDFSGAADEPGWTAVNDGVMGGVSRGGAKLVDGSLHFRGILSLENNGGFSSIRSGGPTRDLNAAQAIVLPGVGAFGDGMAALQSRGLAAPLQEWWYSKLPGSMEPENNQPPGIDGPGGWE